MNEPSSAEESREIPPGWDYNPSAWKQRLPIVGLAVVAFAAAAHLAAYQLRLIDKPWEPFFGEGSRTILDSWVSKILPVSDATLGALSYVLDAVAGIIGGTRRWKTMPWIVVLFGILVGPLGAVSVGLVILQPLLFDAWCTLCLLTALLSVLMIGPAMDEVLASLQHLKRKRAEGESVWRAFWGLSAHGAVAPRPFGVLHRTR
jgi:uncharacterized membrane protein